MNQPLGAVAITGSNRGLGLALAEAFNKSGSKLILHARTEAKLSVAITKFQLTKDSIFVGDLREANTLSKFADVFSKMDGSVLVNNACMHCPNLPFSSFSDEMIDEMIMVNLSACLKLTRHALVSQPNKFITIVNINSMVGIEPKKNRAAYGASKAGLKAFSDSLKLEFENEKKGRVINVFLSRVKTREEFNEGMLPSRVAERIVSHIFSASNLDLTLDGRVDKSLEV